MHTFFRNNSSTYLILFKWRLKKISREIARYVSFNPFFVFRFWSLLATKIWKYYVIFVYILQGKMGKTEKTGKKITQLKWPKYQKPKVNTTSDIQNTNRWHSTFCQFLSIMKRFYCHNKHRFTLLFSNEKGKF